MPEAVARCAAVAVVPHLDPQLVRPVADDHVRVAGVRVLQRVGQALLDDPIRREVDPARKRERLTVDVQLDGQPGAADLVEQRVEAVKPGLRHKLRFLTVASHRGQKASHLGQRHAPGALHALERIAVLVERLGQLVPDGADLEHHHADGVGDDVVELARDPRALLRHRDARCCLTLALGPDRTFLGCLGLVGALAQGVAGEPGDDEPKGDEDELAGRRRVGDVVDDDDDPEGDDGEAEARLQAAPQISEHERGRQPHDAEAPDERNQESVVERDRRGQHPVGRRPAEGEPPPREDRRDEDHQQEHGEPQVRRRCARRIATDDKLQHAGDRQKRDQGVHPVRPREILESGHTLKVLQVFPRRLLPE